MMDDATMGITGFQHAGEAALDGWSIFMQLDFMKGFKLGLGMDMDDTLWFERFGKHLYHSDWI